MTLALLLSPRTTLALVDALDRAFSAAVVLTVLYWTAVSPLSTVVGRVAVAGGCYISARDPAPDDNVPRRVLH